MNSFRNADGSHILRKMVKAIQKNKAYLGEVDGLIGDGDHGMNMNKGFTLFESRFLERDISFTDGLYELGNILLTEIGGSMGPIYGTLFINAADEGNGIEWISVNDLGEMLTAGLTNLQDIVDARVGDKTLIDTLNPAVESLRNSAASEDNMEDAMIKMQKAACQGKESTKDMIAKFGRSSRLGERSRGVLDAGAVSCCIILCAMADGIRELL